MCSHQDPRFAGSNPAEVDGFFQDIKILSTSPPGGTKDSTIVLFFYCIIFVMPALVVEFDGFSGHRTPKHMTFVRDLKAVDLDYEILRVIKET